MNQRPVFLTKINPPASTALVEACDTNALFRLFDEIHSRIASRHHADDMETKLSLLSHELRIILKLIAERVL